jgi:hypothetical protein
MLIHLRRDQRLHHRSSAARPHRDGSPDAASLMAVCGVSLAGLAMSLLVLASRRIDAIFPHGGAAALLEGAIVAIIVCAIVVVAGTADE